MEGAAPAPPEVMAGGGQGGDGPSAQSGVELDFSMVEDSPGEARLSRMEASSAEVCCDLGAEDEAASSAELSSKPSPEGKAPRSTDISPASGY